MLLLRSYIIISLMSLKSYADSLTSDERLVEPNSFQAPGVERVGVSPLPLRNQGFDNLPVGKISQDSEMVKFREAKRGSFETTYSPGRIIYLNGENISSVREQALENVTVHIDKSGNIHIEAPQYEVSADQSYHPLLPKELPQFKKENIYEKMPIPNGTYSKQTGKSVVPEVQDTQHSAELPPTMAKEIIPEANSKAQIPEINVDETKLKDNTDMTKTKENASDPTK